MSDVAPNGSDGSACTAHDSSDRGASSSVPPTAPAKVGKGTVIIAVIAMLMGAVFGFVMSSVGLP